MAIPGNWLVGDPGHVDEHNRIYQDLASKVELYNALDGLQYSAPVYMGDVPPEDEGVIWIDTSDDWYPFPQGQGAGDILVVNDPAEKLSVEWIPGNTYASLNRITAPILSGFTTQGDVTPTLTRGAPSLQFPGSGATNHSYAISPVMLPDNWNTYSFHLIWTNPDTQNVQTVKWRIARKSLTPTNKIPELPLEASGPSDQNTPETNVVVSTQIGGTYTRSENPLSLIITRLSTEDSHSDNANLLALELRKES